MRYVDFEMIILLSLLCIFSCSVIFSLIWGDDQNKHPGVLLGVAVLSVLIACLVNKEDLPDYEQYVSYFNIADTDIISLEPTFVFISYLTKILFNGEPFWGFAIYLILGTIIKVVAIRRLTDLWFLSFALYIGSYWVYYELIQIRIGVASAFFLMALRPLFERNLKQFLLYSFCAICFHYSAIMILPLWFINGSLRNRYFYILLIPACIILYFLHVDLMSLIGLLPIPYIQNKIETYTLVAQLGSDRGMITSSEYNPFISWYLIKAFFAIIMWFFIKRISEYNQYAVLLLKIYTIGIALLWCLPSIPIAATRCSELLSIVQIVLIPLAVYSVKQRKIFYSIPILYGVMWIYWNASSFLFNT